MTTSTSGRSGVPATPDRVTPLLKGALPPALILGAAVVAGSAFVAGSRGAIGAALGVAIVVLFSGTGLLAMRLARNAEPMLAMVIAMASYGLRVLLFGVAIALTGMIPNLDEVLERNATLVAVLVCLTGWLAGEIRAFTRLRVPTYDVELPPRPAEEGTV